MMSFLKSKSFDEMMPVLLKALRPKQWTKNLFVLAPVIFTENAFSLAHWLIGLEGFVLFCLASSSIYILNDLLDRRYDALHPRKRFRPIASGALSPQKASIAALVLGLAAFAGSFAISSHFLSALAFYYGLALAYSLILRQVFLLDILTISSLYVVRVIGGVFLMKADISPWILVATFFLALLLTSLKRLVEVEELRDQAPHFRRVLTQYQRPFLQALIQVFVTMTITTYALYTFLSSKAADQPYLMLTNLFVIYGILRCWYLMTERFYPEMEELVLKDRPLLLTILMWAAFCALLLNLD